MLGRLSLVIHWIGFLASAAALGWACLGIAVEGLDVLTAEDGLVIGIMVCVPITLGWLFRFIISAQKNLLPWVANKETEQRPKSLA